MGQRRDGISRRDALKTVAVGGTILGGAAWIAPSVISTAVAQAAGSGPPPTTTTSNVRGTTVVNNTTTTTIPDGPNGGTHVLGSQVGRLPVTGMSVKPVVAAGLGLIGSGAVIAAMADRIPSDAPPSEED